MLPLGGMIHQFTRQGHSEYQVPKAGSHKNYVHEFQMDPKVYFLKYNMVGYEYLGDVPGANKAGEAVSKLEVTICANILCYYIC